MGLEGVDQSETSRVVSALEALRILQDKVALATPFYFILAPFSQQDGSSQDFLLTR